MPPRALADADPTQPISADEVFAAATPEPEPVAEAPKETAAPSGRNQPSLSAVAERAPRGAGSALVDLMGLAGTSRSSALRAATSSSTCRGTTWARSSGATARPSMPSSSSCQWRRTMSATPGRGSSWTAEQYRARRAQSAREDALAEADKGRRTQKELVSRISALASAASSTWSSEDDPDVEHLSEGEGEQRQHSHHAARVDGGNRNKEVRKME